MALARRPGVDVAYPVPESYASNRPWLEALRAHLREQVEPRVRLGLARQACR